MRKLAAAAVIALAAAVTTSAPLRAQTIDPAAATELFKQGRALMEQGNYKEACPKFAESLRLDAKVGTLLNLAECEEKLGALAAARQHLQRAIDQARIEKDDRLALAMERFAAIDKRVPRLTVALAAGAPPGTIVKRDDVQLAGASLDTALPVDPGEHVVVASAPGYESKTFTVKLAEGAQQRLEVSPGARLPDVALAPAPGTSPATDASPAADTGAGSGSSQRTWGLIVGGVGVVGVGVGTAFGLIALSKNSESKNNGACDSNNVCDQAGKTARDDARSAGNISTLAFVAGGVAIAAGAVLVLTAPSSSKPNAARVDVAPIVGASSGGFFVTGRW